MRTRNDAPLCLLFYVVHVGFDRCNGAGFRFWWLWRWVPHHFARCLRSGRMAGGSACSQRVPGHIKADAAVRSLLPMEPASDDVRHALLADHIRADWLGFDMPF